MERTDSDKWNLARSAGAAARAAAGRQADPARFFDAFVTSFRSESPRQVVVVGSGLDSRAYRLHWPADIVVYEIDQPDVIEFKESTMARLGATPTVQLRTVAADLRHEWPTALQQAGFDPERPAAWLAEGLLIGCLHADAQERLLRQITELSADGSKMVADHLPGESASIGSLLLAVAERWKEQGFDVDFGNLNYPHDRNDADEYLQAHGWSKRAGGDQLSDRHPPLTLTDGCQEQPGANAWLAMPALLIGRADGDGASAGTFTFQQRWTPDATLHHWRGPCSDAVAAEMVSR